MNRNTESRLALTEHFESIAAMRNAKAIRSRNFADLNYPNKKQFSVFPSYVCMANLAEQWGCKTVLEIGAGSSTTVWADFAKRTGASICTIDANPGRLNSYVRDTGHDETVSSHVEFIAGTTIGSRDLIDFYDRDPQPRFGGIAVAACMEYFDLFQHRNCSIRRWHGARRIAERWNWSASELLTRDSSLYFPRRLLDLYSSARNFENEIAFLDDVEARGKSGIIDKLVAAGKRWDLIFFDSGELSSMIEWTLLKDRINVGGFAAFHDIFFPKSIKNIVPCAAIMADPDWELVFLDESSPQGLMIAKRLK